MIYLYARVSSKEQSLERQIASLMKKYPDGILKYEKTSGKNIHEREVLAKILADINPKDTLVITSLDRLSRSYSDILDIYSKLKKRQAYIDVIETPLISTVGKSSIETDIIQNIVLAVLGSVAEMERQKIKERQAQGYRALKKDEKGRMLAKTGNVVGRPSALDNLTMKQKEIIKAWRAGKHTYKEAVALTGLGKSTLYRLAKELELL